MQLWCHCRSQLEVGLGVDEWEVEGSRARLGLQQKAGAGTQVISHMAWLGPMPAWLLSPS